MLPWTGLQKATEMRLLAEQIMLHADSGWRCLACPVFVWVAPRVAVGRVSLGLPPACAGAGGCLLLLLGLLF